MAHVHKMRLGFSLAFTVTGTYLRYNTRFVYPGEHALFILDYYKTSRPPTGRIGESNQDEKKWEVEVTEHYYNYWLLEVDKIIKDWIR